LTRQLQTSMNKEVILKEVQELCIKLLRVQPEKVAPEARLIEDLDVDSLFAAELGLALERRFKIEVPEEAIPTFKTVAGVVLYVSNKLNVPSA
jgi:acyl carrier protein